MPAAGTRLAYRTVISACPVAIPDPIVSDELGKATSGASSRLRACRVSFAPLPPGASEDLSSRRLTDSVFERRTLSGMCLLNDRSWAPSRLRYFGEFLLCARNGHAKRHLTQARPEKDRVTTALNHSWKAPR
jgi:hypothetical protein